MNAPPSIALARMALSLAERRVTAHGCHPEVRGFWTVFKCQPSDRVSLNPVVHPISDEYYRIIDRISAGEAP